MIGGGGGGKVAITIKTFTRMKSNFANVNANAWHFSIKQIFAARLSEMLDSTTAYVLSFFM